MRQFTCYIFWKISKISRNLPHFWPTFGWKMLTFSSLIVPQWTRNSCRCHEYPFGGSRFRPKGVWIQEKSEHLCPIFWKRKFLPFIWKLILAHFGLKWPNLTFFKAKNGRGLSLEIFSKTWTNKSRSILTHTGHVKVTPGEPLVIH